MVYESCNKCLVLFSFMVVITRLRSHRAVTRACGGRCYLIVWVGLIGGSNVLIVYLVKQHP